jgi:hypothetical protein
MRSEDMYHRVVGTRPFSVQGRFNLDTSEEVHRSRACVHSAAWAVSDSAASGN